MTDAPLQASATAPTHEPPLNAPVSQEETNRGVARATGVLALGNIASRGLGMAREIALSNLFGASRAVDALTVATIIPQTLYDLLIAGHVNSAIVPVLSEVAAREGRRAFWQLVSILLSLLTAILAGLVLLLTLAAPAAVGLIGSGYTSATLDLAAALLRLTAPALIFLGLFSVLSGALYALHSFTYPAFAGVVFNGCIVLVTLLFTPPPVVTTTFIGGQAVWEMARPIWGVQAAAVGWLVGAVAQTLLQLPGLRGARLSLSLNWRHPAIRQIARLYAPVMFTLLVDVVVVRAFSYNLASNTVEGALGYMRYATTLIQFPQGLVATAISIAILPTLSRQAALRWQATTLTTDEETAGLNAPPAPDTAFKATLGLGLRLTITLIVPASVGLFVFAMPIVAFIFQHGAFTAAMTDTTAQALRLYLIGLPFAAADLLLVYAFYARQDTLTPALIGLFSFGVYFVAASLLLPSLGLFSLMVADSLKHITHALLSAFILGRRMGGYGQQRILMTLVKTGIAALAMGIVGIALLPPLQALLGITPGGANPVLEEFGLVFAAGGLASLVYLTVAFLLRIDELRWLMTLIRSRLRR